MQFNWRIYQTQILFMCQWLPTVAWQRLLGDLCPRCFLVNCPLLLLLSNILNLKTQQVNDTQAFPYAPLNNPVYMRMHQGWHVTPA
jgi:hypothetical protein